VPGAEPGFPGIDRREEFFDSHCHLQDPAFDADRGAVLARARAAGVGRIVVIGADPAGADAARALADGTSTWYTAGLHPHEAARWCDEVEAAVAAHLDAGAVALGETGLDYHYDHSPRGDQRRAFAAQLEMARARELPVVIHSREAEDDTLQVLGESGIAPERVVLHCFSGSREMLERGVEHGYYVSFSGMVTFRNFPADELVPLVPAERLLAETDAPYLAPVPHRGRRNEPAFLPETVHALGRLRGWSVADAARRTLDNARRFYRLGSSAEGRAASAGPVGRSKF